MPDKIQTLHPAGKNGVNIDKGKYEIIKGAIIDCFQNKKELSFADLNQTIKKSLAGRFDGKIPWYVETVKLDLEARGLIERLPGRTPQILRLKS